MTDQSSPIPATHDASRRTLLRAGALSVAAIGASASLGQAQAADSKAGTSAPVPGAFWPDGIRMVVSISMQFEAGAQSEHNNGSPFPSMTEDLPDLPARTWFEYGVREGIPRMLDLWDKHGVKVTSHMVGRAVELNPSLAKEIVQRGHEAAAHGHTWTPHWTMTPEQERASYQSNIDAIRAATGTRPVGFNAFWLRGTPRTLSILQELGFTYHIDDLSADQPMTTTVNGKPFVIVPYTLRNNDIARFGAEGPLTAAAFGQELKDEFDQLYAESAGRRRMMSISMHDRIGGTPARVKVLGDFLTYARKHRGVVFARKDQIARWTLALPNVPGKLY
ncbi:polysaccharide deacetylase family protein [Roseateles sp. MS654]|uniref:polysaccharide deacetylase family protein n=1 Tax=Roseateles sp. MS654 TaxID=3412685 RepID=UPI003C30668D